MDAFASLRGMKKLFAIVAAGLLMMLAACSSDEEPTTQPQQSSAEETIEEEPQPDETTEPIKPTPDPKWSVGEFLPVAPEGVSAHLARTEEGYRLAYGSYGAGGWVVAECSMDWECEISGKLDRVADLTVVELTSGDLRAYFVEINPNTKQKEIFTAEISEDWLTLSNRQSIGFDDGGAMAWGVPDAVVGPDGLVRVFWVVPGSGMANERVISATSTDASGVTFKLDEGDRLTGGYVDFEVVQASSDGWLGIASSSPEGLPSRPQGLFVAVSQNGLDWTIDEESISPSEMSYLDPTAVLNDDGQMELVISRGSNELGQRNYELVRSKMIFGN